MRLSLFACNRDDVHEHRKLLVSFIAPVSHPIVHHGQHIFSFSHHRSWLTVAVAAHDDALEVSGSRAHLRIKIQALANFVSGQLTTFDMKLSCFIDTLDTLVFTESPSSLFHHLRTFKNEIK